MQTTLINFSKSEIVTKTMTRERERVQTQMKD